MSNNMIVSRSHKDYRHGRSKQDYEKKLTEEFLNRLKVRENRTIHVADKPDVFVFLNSIKIGIELTELHSQVWDHDSLHRARYEKWWKVAERLDDRLAQKGLTHVHGTVYFKRKPYENFLQLDADKLIEDLVRVCQEPMPESCCDLFEFSSSSYICECVKWIHIELLDDNRMNSLWWCENLHSGIIASPEGALQDRVAEKAEKSKDYDWSDALGKWLVIVAPGFCPSNVGIMSIYGDVENQPSNLHDSGTFDYIFFWDGFSEKIWELYPAQQLIFEAKDQKCVVYDSRLPSYTRRSVDVKGAGGAAGCADGGY